MTDKEVREKMLAHIQAVRKLIYSAQQELFSRAIRHDEDKFDPDQLDRHREFMPKLAETEYGTPEYQEQLRMLQPVLERHYQVSPHHPEHFPSHGISGMNLIDLLEMLCDWLASTRRQKNGDIFRSIEINQKRFGYSDDLKSILEHTAEFLIQKEVVNANKDS